MYHGKRWHSDPRFAAVMVEFLGTAYYVDDFICFDHPLFGKTVGKIIKLYAVVKKNIE